MRRLSSPPLARRALLVLVPLLAALVPGNALAQAATPAQEQKQEKRQPESEAAVPAPPPGVEEIEIIGERRDNTAQTEAIAVSSFDQSALDEFGVQDVEGLQDFVPSLHIGRVGNQAVITLRGIGLENISVVGEPSVIFDVDGVPLGRPSAALSAAFFDLEGLDVFRGPQGTSGGRQSTGGKISLRSKRPDPEFSMGGDFQYGTRQQKLSRGYINVPIFGDFLLSRLSIYHEDRYGYQSEGYFLTQEQVDQVRHRESLPASVPLPPDPNKGGVRDPNADYRLVLNQNISNRLHPIDLRGREHWADDAKDLALRGQLLSHPNDDLELRLIATYSQQKGVGPAPTLIRPGAAFPQCPDDDNEASVCPPEILGPYPNAFRSPDPRQGTSNEDQFRDNFQWGVTFLGDYTPPNPVPLLGDVKASVIASEQKNVNQFLLDLDAMNASFTNIFSDGKAVQRSVEARLESVEAEDLEWKFGVFYYQEDNGGTSLVEVPFSSGSSTGGSSTGSGNVGGATVRIEDEVITKSLAGYGELSYWLTDEIKLTGGARWLTESKRAHQLQDNAVPFFTPTASWDDWLPKGELLWQFTDTNNVSFSVTKGLKAGGFVLNFDSLNKLNKGESLEFDAESVYQYQITSKNQLFDESLTLNVVGFWTTYSSYQSCQITATSFDCVGGGKAQLRGIEVESTWKPELVPGLALNGNFNYLDTRLDAFLIPDPTDPGNTQNFLRDLRGNTLPRSPRFAVNVGIQYDVDVGKYGVLTPRVQYNWQDETFFRTFNKDIDRQPPFFMADAKISWRSADDRYNVEAFVENITDVDVLNNQITGPIIAGSPVLGFYRPPRTWGVRFGWRWQ